MNTNNNKTKFLTFFLFSFFLSSCFSSLFVQGIVTELSNPTRTPSLEGNTDYDYQCDYTVDYTLAPDFPPRTVTYIRLYYEANDATPDLHVAMSSKDSNTYQKNDFSPQDMGATLGDTVYFYFKILDSEGDSDTTPIYSFNVNDDTTPPTVGSVSISNNYPEEATDETFSSTITDNIDVSSATLYYKGIGSGSGWSVDYKDDCSGHSMTEGGSNVWSYTETSSWDYSLQNYQCFVLAKDPKGNVGGDWYGDTQNGDAVDFAEGTAETSVTPFYTSSTAYSGTTMKMYFSTTKYYCGIWLRPYYDLATKMDLTDYDAVVIRFQIVDGGSRNYRAWFGVSDNDGDYWNHDTSSGWASPFSYSAGWITMLWKFPRTGGQVSDWSAIERLRFTFRTVDDSYFASSSYYLEVDYIYFVRTTNFQIYDWDSPYIGTPSHAPSSDIESDDSVTISATITDNVDVTAAGIYTFHSGSWVWDSMSEGASNVWSGTVDPFPYGSTIDYVVHSRDAEFNQQYVGTSSGVEHDFNEGGLNGFTLQKGHSLSHDDANGWAILEYDTTEVVRMTRSSYYINTANYRMFFIRWKTNTAYEQKFYGIRDDTGTYVSLYSDSSCYYTNYYGDSADGWIITYGFFRSSQYDTETTLQLTWTPKNYPNQNTATCEYIYVDYIVFAYPKTYDVVDVTGPTMSNPSHNPTNPDDTDDIILSVDASDTGSGIKYVRAYYRTNGGAFSYSTDYSSPFSWNIGSYSVDDLIEYYFYSEDNSGLSTVLNNGGNYYSITIADNTNPVLSNPSHNPVNPKETDTIIFYVDVTDNGFIDTVLVYYRINSGSWTSQEMVIDTGDTYKYILGTLALSDFLEYYFWANDTYSNTQTLDNSGNYYGFTVTDQTAPTINSIERLPDPTPYDIDALIRANVTDNGDLDTILLYYKINTGSWSYVQMSLVNSFYEANITETNYIYGDTIYYYVWANDTANNIQTSNTYSFSTSDENIPSLLNAYYLPEDVEYLDYVTFHVNATDSASGIDYVKLKYRVVPVPETWHYINMTHEAGTTHYYATFRCNHTAGDGYSYEWYIKAFDISGNSNETAYDLIDPTDVTSPTLSNFARDKTEPLPTQNVIITVDANDYSLIAIAKVYYRLNSGSWSSKTGSADGSGHCTTTLDKQAEFTLVEYYYFVEDTYGNNATTSIDSYTVKDVTPPVINSVLMNNYYPVVYDTSPLFCAYVTDNGNIQLVTLHYKYVDNSTWTNVSMSYNNDTGFYEKTLEPFLHFTFQNRVLNLLQRQNHL